MPHARVIAPVTDTIVRYRCYYCGEPWWENLTKPIKGKDKYNTIVMLCDLCEEEFYEHIYDARCP
jgi:formylmethanofuran dehydrogenase subunit E